jgi:Tfp pilus assembly pilus retraction ATPase PilT
MAGVLKGVVSQRLIPRIDGGRVAAVEVMVMNSRISDLIRENETESIPEAIADGDFFDMQTFTQALIDHVVAGRVDREVAANASTNRHDFLVSLDQATKRQVHAEQVAAQESEQARRQAEGADLPELRLA